MKILILLCFFLAPFAFLAQDWKDIPTPEAMLNTNDYEIAVDGSGDSYFIFSNSEDGGIGLYVLKYEPFEQTWDTIYNYSFSNAYSQNLKSDVRGDEIFISLQVNQSYEVRYYVFSIINDQVNLEINPTATNIDEYEDNYFTVGNNADEYFWFAKKQYESKYFISRYNSLDGTLISDTVPNSDAAYFSERRMSLVGDTLWIAYSTEQSEYHILKKHKTDENYYTFDNSQYGVFTHNGENIQSYSVNWMSNRQNKLVFVGENQMDEIFAYSFSNGIIATDEIPTLAPFDNYAHASSTSNIYVTHTTFDPATDVYPTQVLKKDLSTGTWTQIGDDFSTLNESYIRLGYSSTSDRLVSGSKYISEVNYDNQYFIRVLNIAPDVPSINFVQETSICPESSEANLTQTFEVKDFNFDSLNIISVISSDESIIQSSSISFSTLSQTGNTTQFQLVGTTLSSGSTILTIEITDGYDTITVNKTINVLTVSPPTIFDQTFCGSAVVGNLVASGTSVSWFPTNDPTSSLSASTSLTSDWYYANQTISGCVSDIDSILVTINTLPSVQAGSDITICAGQSVTLSGSGAYSYSWNLGVFNGTSFVPSATATYTVTGTDINGCTSTDQVIVTVYTLPNVQAGTDVSVCAGQSVTLSGSGGAFYSWTLGVSNGNSFVPGSTATYTLTGTDVNGCVNTDQVTVTVNPLPNVQAGTDQTICNGQSVTLSGSGASTYSWNLGVTDGTSFVPSATATYTVTGTDINGCTSTDQVIVTVNALPSVQAGTDVTVCNGQSVTLSGSGASSYSWNLGVVNATSFVPSATATYTVTGTDIYGCTNTDQVLVTVKAIPNVQAGTDITVCNGQSVTLTATGAATLSWNLGVSNGIAFVPTSTATYTVTGTSAAGCTKTDQVVVTVNALPSVQAGIDVTLCAGQSVTLSGSGATSFSWNLGAIDGTSFVPTSTATYTVTGTDINGCTNTDQVNVTVNQLPNVQAGTDITICKGQPVTLSGSGANTYSWDQGITNGISFAPNTTATYTVTGTDANGCINTDQVIVTVKALPNTQAGSDITVCNGQSVILTATGGASFSWDLGVSNGVSFTPTSTATYTVTGTAANGCTKTDQVIVTVNALPNVQAGNDITLCDGQSVTLSGSGAVSYSWDLSVLDGISFIPTSTATYTLTGTDINGCTNTDQVNVTVNQLPNVQAGTDITICKGQAVTLSGSGANTYNWDQGITNGISFAPNATATYTVTGTDANGCTNTDQVIVTVKALPNTQAGNDVTVCAGQSVTLTATGGVTFSWDLGVSNGISFVPTSTATYTVTGTSAAGCTKTDQVVVTVNALPIVDAGTDVSLCDGQSVTLSGSGAVSYAWDLSVLDGISFIPTTTATYTVTGTDLNGCTNTDQVTVTVNTLPSVQAGTDVTVCEGQSVTLSGSGAVSYSWDLSVLDGISFVPSTTATYTVTGTDANGCINTDQVLVTVNTLPNVQAGADLTVCAGQSVTLAGSGADSYAWDFGVIDGTSFIPTTSATYTVTGTDVNGCTNIDHVIVTVNSLPIVQAGIDVTVCEGQTVTLNGSGADSYTWDLSVLDGISFIPTSTATYTVTGTDLNGCTNTDQVTVTVNTLPSVQAGTDVTVCEGQSVTLDGSGADSYSWDLSVLDGISFIPTSTATYTVTGTDLNGCTNTDQVTVTVNTLPSVQAGTDVTVCEGQSVTLVGSGADSYSWDLSVLDGISFVPSATTTYTVTGTDVNGCTNTDQVIVNVNALPIVQAGTDVNLCDGESVILTASGADTYSWDLGVIDGISFIPTSTATYTVIGTDANGCTNTDQVIVTVNALPIVQAGADITICSSDAVTLNGSGSGSLSWSNNVINGEIFYPTSTTIYTLTVVDLNGCSATDDIQVIVNNQPQINMVVAPTSCADSTGTATASISSGLAPYSYYWSDGSQNVLSVQNLPAGTFYIFVQDANGCQAIGTAVVQPTSITVTPTITPVTCYGGNNGSLLVDIQGLPAPYSIYWSSGHSTNSVVNLPSGTYEFTAVNQAGCVATGSYFISQPEALQTDITVIQPDCNVSNGSISITGTTGGTPTYSYDWSNGGSGNSQLNLAADIYSITTTDAAGCQTINTVYLSTIGSPNVLGQVTLPTCEASVGAIDVSINSLSPYDVSWSTGATSEDISGLAAGSYTCTVTDNDGCVRVKGWNLKNIRPDVQEICLVTVDSVTTTNLIVWEKPVSSIISYYGIYRETSVIGEYILIDTVHYDNLSVFNDVVASPLARSWRYKIAAFNFCDDQSDLSNHHKTLHLNTFDQGGTSTLVTWDQYEGASYTAFDLWRYTNATGWELITTVGTGTLSYVDPIPLTTEGLDYMVEINFTNICTATVMKAQDFNKSRSNKEKGIFDPGAGQDDYSNNGIQETNLSNLNVKLYPNPTQGEFTVALTEQVQLKYEIISLTGTIHASGTLNDLENVFQLDYLESGMYYLRLSSNTDSKHLPFIIKK